MSSQSEYILIDKEKAKTYLFNSFIYGDVNKYRFSHLYIYIKGTQYIFDKDFNLTKVIPSLENAYALTTKGFVEWKNKMITVDHGMNNYLTVNGLYENEIICSDYICLDYPSKDHIALNKDNIVKIGFGFLSYEDLKVKETDDKLVIKHQDDMPWLIGAKIENEIYQIHVYGLGNKLTIIIPRGTCFRVNEKYKIYKSSKLIEGDISLEKPIDLCY